MVLSGGGERFIVISGERQAGRAIAGHQRLPAIADLSHAPRAEADIDVQRFVQILQCRVPTVEQLGIGGRARLRAH